MEDDPFEVSGKVAGSLKSPKSPKEKGKRKESYREKESLEREHSTAASMGESDEKRLGGPKMTMSEQVDALIDHCIEIESNKRMIKENVRWVTLTFHSKDMESKAS